MENNRKIIALTFRVSEEEKKLIEQKAKERCMSINQYTRYKVFEYEELESVENERYALKFLNKNLPMITRIILDGYFHVRALARQNLTEEDYKEINEEEEIEFKRLGIKK